MPEPLAEVNRTKGTFSFPKGYKNGYDGQKNQEISVFMNLKFCDLMCKYARNSDQEAIDGAGSCMTFTALYCDLRKSLVHKNLPCKRKVLKKERPITEK